MLDLLSSHVYPEKDNTAIILPLVFMGVNLVSNTCINGRTGCRERLVCGTKGVEGQETGENFVMRSLTILILQ
jgi:hypothetical protein